MRQLQPASYICDIWAELLGICQYIGSVIDNNQ